jgi:uncharacterized protein (TIGR00290 family)
MGLFHSCFEKEAAVRALVSWSGGKDSAWALHRLRRNGVEVAGLLVTHDEGADALPHHAVRLDLLRAQARATGLPLVPLALPPGRKTVAYIAAMTGALMRAREQGVTHVVFGDLYLEDVRAWRDELLESVGLKGLYPLWGEDTGVLAREMIAGGLQARVVSVDTDQLDGRFAGRVFDNRLLRELPIIVDPCGERGEFHTFVTDAPGFARPLRCRVDGVRQAGSFALARLELAERRIIERVA